MLEPTKKRYRTSKDKEEARRQWEGSYQDKMKSYAHWVGNLQTGKTIIPKKLSHCCKGSRPHIMPPRLGLGIPSESDFEGQKDLITGLPQHWGKQRLHS